MKPAALPFTDATSNKYVQETYEVDQSHTFTICNEMDSVTLNYVITQNDKLAYFVTDLDLIIGNNGSDSYYYYSYNEYSGSIEIFNHETGMMDEFNPNDQIPLGPDSPYVKNGMMTVTFDMTNGSGYSYYNTVLPELFVEKGWGE